MHWGRTVGGFFASEYTVSWSGSCSILMYFILVPTWNIVCPDPPLTQSDTPLLPPELHFLLTIPPFPVSRVSLNFMSIWVSVSSASWRRFVKGSLFCFFFICRMMEVPGEVHCWKMTKWYLIFMMMSKHSMKLSKEVYVYQVLKYSTTTALGSVIIFFYFTV